LRASAGVTEPATRDSVAFGATLAEAVGVRASRQDFTVALTPSISASAVNDLYAAMREALTTGDWTRSGRRTMISGECFAFQAPKMIAITRCARRSHAPARVFQHPYLARAPRRLPQLTFTGEQVNIHEYQAKEILRGYGVPIPPGDVATTPARPSRSRGVSAAPSS
jgi:hypothetical protein